MPYRVLCLGARNEKADLSSNLIQLFLRIGGSLLYFHELFVRPPVGGTRCIITRDSLAIIVAFNTEIFLLLPSVIIIFVIVAGVIGSISLTKGETSQLKIDKM